MTCDVGTGRLIRAVTDGVESKMKAVQIANTVSQKQDTTFDNNFDYSGPQGLLSPNLDT